MKGMLTAYCRPFVPCGGLTALKKLKSITYDILDDTFMILNCRFPPTAIFIYEQLLRKASHKPFTQ
jgi:hypothetical protein